MFFQFFLMLDYLPVEFINHAVNRRIHVALGVARHEILSRQADLHRAGESLVGVADVVALQIHKRREGVGFLMIELLDA